MPAAYGIEEGQSDGVLMRRVVEAARGKVDDVDTIEDRLLHSLHSVRGETSFRTEYPVRDDRSAGSDTTHRPLIPAAHRSVRDIVADGGRRRMGAVPFGIACGARGRRAEVFRPGLAHFTVGVEEGVCPHQFVVAQERRIAAVAELALPGPPAGAGSP